jgi:cytoskeleton protein RodZ
VTQSTQTDTNEYPGEPDQPSTGLEGLGALLRQAREELGLTVGQVASSMRLSDRVVERLESETVDFADAPVYLRGYLRNYARLVHQEALLPTTAPEPMAPTAWEPARSEDHPWVRLWEGVAHRSAYLVATLLVIGTLAAWVYQPGTSPADGESLVTRDAIDAELLADATRQTPSAPARRGAQPASMTPLPMVSSSTSPRADVDEMEAVVLAGPLREDVGEVSSVEPEASPEGVSQAPPQSANERVLVIRATQDSWVQVEQGDSRLVYDLIQAGGERRVVVESDAPIQLLLGYAPGVEVLWAGETLDLAPHTRADVARLSLQAQ